MRSMILAAAVLVAATACSTPDDEAAPNQAAVVDSAVPWQERLSRFRANLSEVQMLGGGRDDRDALVAAFVQALQAQDTALVRELTLTKEEFAYLYYPTTPMAYPPYDLDPELMWFMMYQRSNQGITKAFMMRGGRPLGFEAYRCEGEETREGANTVWGPCIVTRTDESGAVVEERLFSQIIERGGVYKFLNLSNGLD